MPQAKRFRATKRSLNGFTQSRFVEREEFCKLLVGNRKIVRSDEPGKRLMGLIDVATGTRFLISRKELIES